MMAAKLKVIRRLGKGAILSFIAMAVINLYVSARTAGYIYTIGPEIPESTYGLVLGTSKYRIQGGLNRYYIQRIEAAVSLYKMGKIDTLIVSGDHREPSYNEPARMRASLVESGVPETVILTDGQGIDTKRSVLGFKERHGDVDVTIITQRFHTQRAVYYALENNIRAIGANASDTGFFGDPKMFAREYFAKIKAFFQ